MKKMMMKKRILATAVAVCLGAVCAFGAAAKANATAYSVTTSTDSGYSDLQLTSSDTIANILNATTSVGTITVVYVVTVNDTDYNYTQTVDLSSASNQYAQVYALGQMLNDAKDTDGNTISSSNSSSLYNNFQYWQVTSAQYKLTTDDTYTDGGLAVTNALSEDGTGNSYDVKITLTGYFGSSVVNKSNEVTTDTEEEQSSITISTAGSYTLSTGTAYTLSSNKFTISGDPTVYESNITFYASAGTYTFSIVH